MAYKQEQGRMARMAAYWSLAVLLFYGCYSLYYSLLGWFPGKLGTPFKLGAESSGLRIPILGIDVNAALVIATLVLAAGLFVLYRWQNKPSNADFLIETESELRKVTWPSMPEAIGSSFVVILTVLFLMFFLAGSDWLLGRWATWILTGGSN